MTEKPRRRNYHKVEPFAYAALWRPMRNHQYANNCGMPNGRGGFTLNAARVAFAQGLLINMAD